MSDTPKLQRLLTQPTVFDYRQPLRRRAFLALGDGLERIEHFIGSVKRAAWRKGLPW